MVLCLSSLILGMYEWCALLVECRVVRGHMCEHMGTINLIPNIACVNREKEREWEGRGASTDI